MARGVWRFGKALLALPIALMFQILISGLLLLGLLPIPQLRTILSSILFNLNQFLGDSLAIESPSKQSHIFKRVQRDYEWLRKTCQCQKVAVLAHSQGAFVVTHALKELPKKKVDLLITLGSGLQKLAILDNLNTNVPQFFLAFGLGVPIAFFALGRAIYLGITGEPLLVTLVFVGIGVAFLLGTILFLQKHGDVEPTIEKLKNDFPTWKDFYASHDPVPDGEIPGLVGSQSITNRLGVIEDHTGYWSNRDEFVRMVADGLWKVSSDEEFPKNFFDNSGDYKSLSASRYRRAWAFRIGKYAFLLGLIFIWAMNAYKHGDKFLAFKNAWNEHNILEQFPHWKDPLWEMLLSHDSYISGGPLAAGYVSLYLVIWAFIFVVLWNIWDESVFLNTVYFNKAGFWRPVFAILCTFIMPVFYLAILYCWDGRNLLEEIIFLVAEFQLWTTEIGIGLAITISIVLCFIVIKMVHNLRISR